MNPMHEKIDGELLDLIEGRLSPEERQRVHAWLAADPKLAHQVAGMVLDRQMLRSLPKTPAPPGLAEGVLSRLERGSLLTGFEQDVGAVRRRVWRVRLAIAASIAILAGGLGFVILEGVVTHKGPWGDWASAPQVAATGRPKVPDQFETLGGLASASHAEHDALLKAPTTESASDETRTAMDKAGQIPADGRIATATPPAVSVTPPTSPAAQPPDMLAKAGGGGRTAASVLDETKAPAEPPLASAGPTYAKSAGHFYKGSDSALALKDGSLQNREDRAALLESVRKSAGAHTPVVLTLAVRDAADADQVQALLASFAAPEAPRHHAEEQAGAGEKSGYADSKAGNDLANKSDSVGVGASGGANTYTGATTINKAKLPIQPEASVPTAANAPATTDQERVNVPSTGNTQQDGQNYTNANQARTLTGQLAMPMSRAQQIAQQDRYSRQHVTVGGLAGTSYHLRLTPQQFETLARSYNIRVNTPATAEKTLAKPTADDFAQGPSAKDAIAAATQPPAAAAANQPAASRVVAGLASERASSPMSNATEAPQNTRDINQAAVGNQKEISNEVQTIDCIINVVTSADTDAAKAAAPAQAK